MCRESMEQRGEGERLPIQLKDGVLFTEDEPPILKGPCTAKGCTVSSCLQECGEEPPCHLLVGIGGRGLSPS